MHPALPLTVGHGTMEFCFDYDAGIFHVSGRMIRARDGSFCLQGNLSNEEEINFYLQITDTNAFSKLKI